MTADACSTLVCRSLCQNVFVWSIYTRKGLKITVSQVRADDGGWSNTSHRKRFRSPYVAAAVCDRALSWRRTIPEDNIPRRLFWIKESNYSTHSKFGGRLYCFRRVYGLSTCSELTIMRCVVIDGHTRDIAQHICAKLLLILTVILCSMQIRFSNKVFKIFLKRFLDMYNNLKYGFHEKYIILVIIFLIGQIFKKIHISNYYTRPETSTENVLMFYFNT